tara:strand:- start:134 stop:553 length:420 start_codon:yes stop_codon:yes gene_type:complete
MANGLKPIGDSIKVIIEKLKKEREERKRNKNKPVRTQPKLPGMKKGGKITQKDIDKTEEGVMIVLEKKANGGITGKSTMGQLKKKYGSLKKGIRLKGKGSSFMKEYKKRVYNRAGGGSMNGGVRGTGIAVKGKNFKGVF